MANDSIELGRIRAKVLKLENKVDDLEISNSNNNITGNLEFARSPETKILFNSDVNYGSDKAFILYKQDSAYHVNASNENSRLSIGVFNDNENAVGEGLDLQGAASLIFNVGQWDSELNNIIGGQYNNVLPSSPIKFRINNSDVAAFSSNGNFGIGTASPLAKLSIGAGSLADSNVPVQINAPTGLVSYYGANNNGAYGALFGYDSTLGGVVVRAINSSDDVSLVTNNTTRVLNVKSNGNVGIGTTSPQSTLHAKGTVAYGTVRLSPASDNGEASMGFYQDAAGTDTNDSWIVGQGGWGNTGKFTIGNENNGAGGNVRLVIEKAGNVGIGTTSPGTKLDIAGNLRFSAGSPEIEFNNGGPRIGNVNAIANTLTFHKGGGLGSTSNETMRIDSNGNVGIGTAAPPSKFSVAGSQGNANGITVTSNDVATIITHDVATNGGMIQVKSGGSSTSIGANNYRLLLQPEGGNVGIGVTAPETKLHIYSTDDTRGLKITNSDAGSYAEIHLNASHREYRIGAGGNTAGDSRIRNKFYVYDMTAGAPRITLNSNGYVGIGSQDASVALHVRNGNSYYGNPEDNDLPTIYASNINGTSTSAHALLGTRVNGANAGDPFVSFDILGVRGWSAGIDNSDDDKFKIASSWHDVGTDTRLTIDTAGQVGIGTTNPGFKLSIAGSTDQYPALLGIYETSHPLSRRAGMQFGNNWVIGQDTAGDGDRNFFFYNGGTGVVPLFISSDNKIGIGTTSPDSKLHVNGGGLAIGQDTSTISSVDGGKNSIQIATDTYYGGVHDDHTGMLMYSTMPGGWGTSQLEFRHSTNWGTYASSPDMVIGDRVGIGTTSPSTKLQVNAKIIDDNSYSYDTNSTTLVHPTPTATATLNDPKTVLLLGRQGTSGQAYGAGAVFNISRYENAGVNSRTRLDISLAHNSFDVNSNTVLTAYSNGNIGIGTTPSYRLHVYGAASEVARFENNGSDDAFIRVRESSTEDVVLGSTNGVGFVGSSTNNNFALRNNNTNRAYVSVNGLVPWGTNTYSCGTSGELWSAVYVQGGVLNGSDKRIKKDIENSDLGLEFINQLRPVKYRLKNRQNVISIDENGNESVTPTPGIRFHYGLIAQEVKEVLGDKDFAGYAHDPETDWYGLRYEQFISPAIKAIQELSTENDYLKKKLEEKDKQLQDILLRLSALESK